MLGRLVAVAALAYGGVMLARKRRSRPAGRGMQENVSEVEAAIEVDVPVRTAYDQWAQFEEFPRFMSSVPGGAAARRHPPALEGHRGRQDQGVGCRRSPGRSRRRIAWRSITGPLNAGVVTFDKVSSGRTRVTLRMAYVPETIAERLGDAMGAVRMEAHRNLKRFKELIEDRGSESGAWRGTVEDGKVQH